MNEEFVESEQWKDKEVAPGQLYTTLEFKMIDGVRTPVVHSLSGNERNKLFINQQGSDFQDQSLVSGADSIADGRCFAIWDYDRDGAQDIALVNLNNPHFQVFKNQNIDLKNNFIAIKLHGGNSYPKPSSEYSNRDGIGSKVTVTSAGRRYVREQKCGEGFSSQNSSTMIIGIGTTQSIEEVKVEWPSGKSQMTTEAEPGTLLTFWENPADSDHQQPIVVTPYVAAKITAAASNSIWQKRQFRFKNGPEKTDDRLHVFITMATWCEACKRSANEIENLKTATSDNAVAYYGIPIDPKESDSQLQSYQDTYQPAYKILLGIDTKEIDRVEKYLKKNLGASATPCTIIATSDGIPLKCFVGIPTTSDVLKLLDSIETSAF